jgi:hypothetical protein
MAFRPLLLLLLLLLDTFFVPVVEGIVGMMPSSFAKSEIMVIIVLLLLHCALLLLMSSVNVPLDRSLDQGAKHCSDGSPHTQQRHRLRSAEDETKKRSRRHVPQVFSRRILEGSVR